MKETELLSKLLPGHPDIFPIIESIREKYQIPPQVHVLFDDGLGASPLGEAGWGLVETQFRRCQIWVMLRYEKTKLPSPGAC